MLAVGWAKPVFGLGWVRVGSVVLTGLAWVGVGCCLSVPARTGARAHWQSTQWLAQMNHRMFTPLLVGCSAETIKLKVSKIKKSPVMR